MTEARDLALESLLSDCWARLRAGADDKAHPFHIMTLASSGLDGRARARSVILRAADPAGRLLSFYSDRRSPKMAEVERDPRVALLFYDPAEGLQIRLEGLAGEVREEERVEEAWRSASRYSRRVYLQEEAPGAETDRPTSGLPPALEGEEPSEEALLPARENFSLLQVRVLKLDWLKISGEGQRRALWRWNEEERPEAGWIVP
jgi:pyridoxamine 5'-phosphate oxidase